MCTPPVTKFGHFVASFLQTRVKLIHKSNQNDDTKPLRIRWAKTTNSWPAASPQKEKWQ